jgi:hypothetical protein
MSHKFRKGMQTYETSQQEYTIREETLNGRTYVVVPVTMMMEGVHAGSHGALLHTAEELGKMPESWNGIPVTIGHPQVEGKPVSANSPEVLEAWQIGVVFNTIINDLKLKSEAWLEKDKLATNENLNDRIANGEIIEVSVGVFSEDELIEGTYHNETYVAVARNLRPDHLAILPNQIGACSIEDGCGIRTNSKNITMDIKKALNQLRGYGYLIPNIMVNSEDEGLQEKLDELRELVRSLNPSVPIDNSYLYHYLIEVFDGYLIYEKDTNQTTEYFKRNYQYNVSTKMYEFTSEPVEVEKKVEYETVQTNEDTGIKRTRKFINNSKKEEQEMADAKCTPCVAKKVNELIANEATSFTENDREWLETLDEVQLNKCAPKDMSAEDKKKAEEEMAAKVKTNATITPEMAVNALKEALKGQDDFINLMPTNMQEQTRSALKLHASHKSTLIEGILANTEEGTWTKEELGVYEVEKLEKISKTAGVKAPAAQFNYSAMGAGTDLHNNAQDEVPFLAPVGINFETK